MPQWNNPYPHGGLYTGQLERVKACPTNVLQLWRAQISDEIEAIADLSYYARPSFFEGQWVTWYNPSEKLTKYWTDMQSRHTLLWEIDAELERREETVTC